MHTVIIDGQDLDYLRTVLSEGLHGYLGDITAVQLYVNDNGRIVLGTNGFTSAEIGRPNAPLGQKVYGSPEEALDDAEIEDTPQWDHSAAENAVAAVEYGQATREQHADTAHYPSQQEGSGNPYANVNYDEPSVP